MTLTTVNAGMLDTQAQYTGFKNRIINPGMVIDQRNAGASVTPAAATYTLDRWYAFMDVGSKFSVQQSTTAPAGFTNSMLITSTSAYTVGAGEAYGVRQMIEGFNAADFGWGTANAQTVTLSFKVRSSLTGTFGGVLRNSANNRTYPFTYTISAANTFEDKSVTIAGDTSGTWLTTNGTGIGVVFGIGVGSTISGPAGAWAGTGYWGATGATSVVGTNGATFYITGVQLEKGSTATSFDYRPYGTEEALCQRYCYMFQNPTGASGDGSTFGAGYTDSSSQGVYFITFPVSMRTTPSLTTVSTANAIEQGYYNGTVTTHNATSISLISNVSSPNSALMLVGGASFSNGTGAFLRYATQSITPCVFVSAEL